MRTATSTAPMSARVGVVAVQKATKTTPTMGTSNFIA
jgi:hypothetical protein